MNALPSLLLELLKNFRIFVQMILFDANLRQPKRKIRLKSELFLGNDIGDPSGIGFSLNLWGKFTVTFAIFVRPFPIHG